MRRFFTLLLAGLALTGIACPPAPTTNGQKKDDAPPDAVVPPPVSLEHLRPRIEGALEQARRRELTSDHGFWTVFHAILGTGLEKTMLKDMKTKEKVSAIDYICKGGKLTGLAFVPTEDGLDVEIRPDLQFKSQGHQDQFIAEMAQWGMPATRKFRVAGRDYTFHDFIQHSKMRASVTKAQELSWAVVIVAQYFKTDHKWTNSFGETITCEDIARYELDASIDEAACGGTHRLFGLTWAYHLHLNNGGMKEGVWSDIDKKIAEYKRIAKKHQNPDGSLSTEYFRGPGRDPNIEARISTTGHMVEWLALAMTDAELRAPWMQSAVSALSKQILDMGNDSIDGGALYHAAHGLHIYHSRIFGQPEPFLPLRPK